MCTKVTLSSVGMFDQQTALQRFPKDCIDLACDYIHRRFEDLNLTDINGAYMPYGSLHPDMREKLGIEISRIGELMEHSRVPWKLFDKFEQTLSWSRVKDNTTELIKSFSNDLFQVVMHSDINNFGWDRVIMAMVMTSTFVRHCADGNRSPECLKALFDGLFCFMTSCIPKAKKLHGWPCMFDHFKRMSMRKVGPDELFTGLVPKPRNASFPQDCQIPKAAVLPRIKQKTAEDPCVVIPCPTYEECSTKVKRPNTPQTSSLYAMRDICPDLPLSVNMNKICETGDNKFRRKRRAQTPPRAILAKRRCVSTERGESLSCSDSTTEMTRPSERSVSFACQGRQMALQVMQDASGRDLSCLAVVGKEEICSFAQDTALVLKIANHQVINRSMAKCVQQMLSLDNGCGPTAEFKENMRAFIVKFLREIQRNGWELLANLFYMLHNFVKMMLSDKHDLCMYQALADIVYSALVTVESDIILTFGGWAAFRVHYERILRSPNGC